MNPTNKRTKILLMVITALMAVMIATAALADSTWTCPTCGAANNGNFCTKDGTARNSGWNCSSCGTANEADALYCKNCGKKNGGSSSSSYTGSIYAGDTIRFGSYPSSQSGAETKIMWRVLKVEGNKALLMTKFALDVQPYNKTGGDCTWETCTLRSWLNNTFINNAFTYSEQDAILWTTVTADRNPEYKTQAGNDTYDRIFLLSAQEAEQYFDANGRMCLPTKWAITIGINESKSGKFMLEGRGTTYWWLRSPGASRGEATYVRPGGALNSCKVSLKDIGVRPVMWVDLTCGLF